MAIIDYNIPSPETWMLMNTYMGRDLSPLEKLILAAQESQFGTDGDFYKGLAGTPNYWKDTSQKTWNETSFIPRTPSIVDEKNITITSTPYSPENYYSEGLGLTKNLVDNKYNVLSSLPSVTAAASNVVKGISPLSRVATPALKVNPLKGVIGGLKSAGIGIAGTIGNKLLNKAISGGFSTGVGNGIADVGNAIGDLAATIPGLGTGVSLIVKGASGALGGLWNHSFGKKTDEEKLTAMNNNANAMRNTGNQLAQANDSAALLEGANNMKSSLNYNPYKGGWLKSGWEKRSNLAVNNRQRAADAVQSYGLLAGVDRVNKNQADWTQLNSAAYGGLFDTMNNGMGVIEYDFLDRDLNNKTMLANAKSRMPGVSPIPAAHRSMFSSLYDLGGDLQTHGADWSNGASHVDAGYTHEENPNQGVQVGIDSQGVPNLVEEGEVIFNDYVYSKRILCDDETKEHFHISKRRDITFADLAKRLEKESQERPNDPISKAGLKAQMADLAEDQERQKAEMQAEEAREAFEAMSPEEQVALMQEAQGQEEQPLMDEAMAQEAAAQQQMPSEEEMLQQQLMQGQEMPMQGGMPPEAMMQGAPMGAPMAYGGLLGNQYGLGGNLFALAGQMETSTTPSNKKGNSSAQKVLQGWTDAFSAPFRLASILSGGRGDSLTAEQYVEKAYPNSKSKKELIWALKKARSKTGGDPNAKYKNWMDVAARTFPHVGDSPNYLLDTNMKNARQQFQILYDLGMSPKAAFELAFPEDTYVLKGRQELANKKRDALYKELVTPQLEQKHLSRKKVVYVGPNGTKYNSLEEANTAGKMSRSNQPASNPRYTKKINEFNSRMIKEFGRGWAKTFGLNSDGVQELYLSYINGHLDLDNLVSAARENLNSQKQESAEKAATPSNASAPQNSSPTLSDYSYSGNIVSPTYYAGNMAYPSQGQISPSQQAGYSQQGYRTFYDPYTGQPYQVPLSQVAQQAMQQQQAAMKQSAAEGLFTPQEPEISPEEIRRNAILNTANAHTWDDLKKWFNDNNIGTPEGWDKQSFDSLNWDELMSNPEFQAAIAKDNPALAHALENRYDFGMYKPDANGKFTFDDDRGNWDAQTVKGWWGSKDPAWQEVLKNHPELKEDTVLTNEQLADYLRNTEAFKKGTKWLQDSENNRLTYLKRIIDNPNAPKGAKDYALKFIDEKGNWRGNVRDYETIFNNASGRAARPGTYWKTPIEAMREAQVKNFIQNDEGKWQEIIGDIPNDWERTNSYSWHGKDDDLNDYTYNYFKKKAAKTAEGAKSKEEAAKDAGRVLAGYKHTWFDPGDLGPLVALGMQVAGVGKPDFSRMDGVLEAYDRRGPSTINYKPIGNYLTYTPMDVWAEQNKMNATSRGTARAIQNNSGPIGTQTAGLLAASLNDQQASGDLYRKALEYDNGLRANVATFNRGTDQFNAEAFNRTSMANAEIMNRDRQLRAQLGMQAEADRLNTMGSWYNGIYGNINNIAKGIGAHARENRQGDMIAGILNTGLVGTFDKDTPVMNSGNFYTYRASQGGKLKRKKRRGGLTY